MILIETIGTGQDEIEIADVADTVVVVLMPAMGDAVQRAKAGLMEIAHITVINKADLVLLRMAESLDAAFMGGTAPVSATNWTRPTFPCSAKTGEGFGGLVDALEAHRQFSKASSKLRGQRSNRKRSKQ